MSSLIVSLFAVCMIATFAHAAEDGMCQAGDACDIKDSEASQSLCPYPPPNLGEYEVDLTVYKPGEIEAKSGQLVAGGSWAPTQCLARQSVAILVPYRDRLQDLLVFLPNLHGFMKHQLLNYTIFLIEQMDRKHFNRGALLNIGVVEALRLAAYDCIILHDVDKFPEDTRNLYMCSDKPVHLISKQRYVNKDYRERPYDDYFGGVTAISTKLMKQINGFSNIFWGWGSEDDDFLARMKHHGLSTQRVEEEVGRYREIWHPYGFVNPKRHEVKKQGPTRFNTDGINSLEYKLHHTTKEKLYTHFGVELLHKDPYM